MMCEFFSLVSNGRGKIFYSDAKVRAGLIESNPQYYDPDSHSSICEMNNVDCDKFNKYEYNPLTKHFKVDQINTKDDRDAIERFCNELDFKTIVPELNIKPIIHPFKDVKRERISSCDLELLVKWDSVIDSVRDSVWYPVRDSVIDSVMDSVWYSVRESVIDSVSGYFGDHVWDYVGAYASSFILLDKWKYIEHEKGVNPFQPGIDLWERGIVPSFDSCNKIWRLHTYKGVVNEFNQKEFAKLKERLKGN